jgi:hypothetical protein
MTESTDNANSDRSPQTESRLSLIGRYTRFKKGMSGNPAGRPKRFGNRPLDDFLTDDDEWPQGMNEVLARKLANRS